MLYRGFADLTEYKKSYLFCGSASHANFVDPEPILGLHSAVNFLRHLLIQISFLALAARSSEAGTPFLQRPSLMSQGQDSQGFVSAEFQQIFERRPQECRDFLDFVERRASGPVSETDSTPMEDFNSFGILIAKKNGKVLYERYYQGAGPKTLFRMYSISKAVTVMSYGIFENLGLLAREELVKPSLGRLVEGLEYPYWDRLNMGHLLTMSSGVPWCEYINCAARDAIAMMFAPHKSNATRYYFENATRGASSLVPLAEPGTTYRYSLGNALVLQAVFKNLLGAKYSSYPSNYLFSKIGATSADFAFEKDGQGVYLGGSGLFLNVPTMAKLGLTLLNDGKYNGAQLLPSSFVKEMSTKILDSLRRSTDPVLKSWEGPTGMGVWLNKDESIDIPSFMPDVPNNMFYGAGYHGRRLMVFPEAGEDGFVVAQVGTNEVFANYWKPYSKKLYACLGRHPELTPNNRGTQVGALPGTSAPKASTFWQGLSAKIDVLDRNVPLQLIALETCNCAFTSKMAIRAADHVIDSKRTLDRCHSFIRPNFEAVPWIWRPVYDNKHVFFDESSGTGVVSSTIRISLVRRYTAQASFNKKSGVCEITQAPKETIVP